MVELAPRGPSRTDGRGPQPLQPPTPASLRHHLPTSSPALCPSICPSICPSLAHSAPVCAEEGSSTALGGPAPRPGGQTLPAALGNSVWARDGCGRGGRVCGACGCADGLQPRARHCGPPAATTRAGALRPGPVAGGATGDRAASCLPCAPKGPRKPGLSVRWDPGGHLGALVLGKGACVGQGPH